MPGLRIYLVAAAEKRLREHCYAGGKEGAFNTKQTVDNPSPVQQWFDLHGEIVKRGW